MDDGLGDVLDVEHVHIHDACKLFEAQPRGVSSDISNTKDEDTENEKRTVDHAV